MVRVIVQAIKKNEGWIIYWAMIDTFTPPLTHQVVDVVKCKSDREAIALVNSYNTAKQVDKNITLKTVLDNIRSKQ